MPSIIRTGYIFLILILMPMKGFSAAPPDTIWNQSDQWGRKQGYWRKYYPNGELLYMGFFLDDAPLGRMQRFYEDGEIKGELNFTGEAETAYATMYFRNGQRGATGKYTGQKRDSVWNYYSYYTGSLTFRGASVTPKRLSRRPGGTASRSVRRWPTVSTFCGSKRGQNWSAGG